MYVKEKTVYALGFFDGVHLGHQALLGACREMAVRHDAKAGAVTFDIHPETLVTKQAPGLINSVTQRNTLLREQGMEVILTLPFDDNLRKMPWQDFFRMLLREYNAAGLVCGDDFHFGYRGEGSAALLSAACRSAGIPCTVVPGQLIDGVRISSTHIRKLLANGDMASVRRFLGHPHILTGEVVSGRGVGRTIGVPTANLRIPDGVLLPKMGVYACRALVDGKEYPAVTNIGTRPTVCGHHVTVEPWLLDFDGDLYGKRLTLEFYQFLRGERRFPDLDSLAREIRKNGEQTRKILENK